MRTANGSEKQPAMELFNFDTVMNTQYSEKPPNRTYTNKESEELRHLTFQNILSPPKIGTIREIMMGEGNKQPRLC